MTQAATRTYQAMFEPAGAEGFPSRDSYHLGLIEVAPVSLAATLGAPLFEDYDDFDWFELCAISLPRIGQVMFLRYRNTENIGPTIYVDAKSSRPRAKAAIIEALPPDLGAKITWFDPRANAKRLDAAANANSR
jgi:hypothetical protein